METLPDDICSVVCSKLAFCQPIKPAIRSLLSLGIVSSRWHFFTQKTLQSHFSDYQTLSDALLSQFPFLEYLSLPQSHHISHDTILKLSNIQKLKIAREEDLTLLTKLKNLRAFSSVTANPYSYLAVLTNLESLTLSSRSLNHEDLPLFSKLTRLVWHGWQPTDIGTKNERNTIVKKKGSQENFLFLFFFFFQFVNDHFREIYSIFDTIKRT